MEMDLFSERTRRLAAWTLFGLALAYAFVAGLRTVADFDVPAGSPRPHTRRCG